MIRAVEDEIRQATMRSFSLDMRFRIKNSHAKMVDTDRTTKIRANPKGVLAKNENIPLVQQNPGGFGTPTPDIIPWLTRKFLPTVSAASIIALN